MLNLKFSNFPELSTERLLLRQLKAVDAPQVHELRSDPEINRYIGRPNSAGIGEAQSFIEKINELIKLHQSFYWAITIKPDDKLIGTICFWNIDPDRETVEIGYELMTRYQGKGIITEAVANVISFGLNEINAKAITAFPSIENLKSVAVLQKLNFQQVAIDVETDHDVENMLKYVLTK